ncbi:MAG TPA: nitroreductase family protein [Caulobacteraceae bacterium]|nr:nitroreductase family protein [Caulobacteraceae bacterium]
MDAIAAIHTRRSIRDYAPRPVDRLLIEDLIWDAAQAPPPFAGQVPWTFNVIEGAERIAALGERAKQYARDNRPDVPSAAWADREDFKAFWNAPAVVIISGPVEDCVRAGQTLLIAAHARGLGACWVGAPMMWLRSPVAKAELGIPPDLTPVSAICLGYPAAEPEPRVRAHPPVIWE